MVIGVLQLELTIIDAMTLKDKRRIVRSLKDRIANGYNVSVAEVGALDEHRRCIMGIAMVSKDKIYVQGALDKLLEMIRNVPAVSLQDYQLDWL